MGHRINSAAQLRVQIAKGWRPSRYLTSVSMAYLAEAGDHVAPNIFPFCPVDFSTGYYYEFAKGDIARDYVQRKPEFGKVTPAKMGHSDKVYNCFVDQVIAGVDDIGAQDYHRAGAPATIDPETVKARFVTEQMLLHRDIEFASNFFGKGVWANEYTGVTATPSGNNFLKFSDANFDPVNFFDERIREIKVNGRRRPNKLCLGYDAYVALKNHPDIIERVKYSGSTPNPAVVNENVLAQLFGLEEVVVLYGTYNKAPEGQEDDMDFVCEPDGALLCYVTATPRKDEPSAGYIFTWDMLGNGDWMATASFDGEGGTHASFVEGLMACDMRKTSDDLGIYFASCV